MKGLANSSYYSTLFWISDSYLSSGDALKAKEIGEKCLTIAESLYGKEHPDEEVCNRA